MITEDDKRLMRELREHMSDVEIAAKFDIAPSIVNYHLGVRKGWTKVDWGAVKLLRSIRSDRYIARLFGIHSSTIGKRLGLRRSLRGERG